MPAVPSPPSGRRPGPPARPPAESAAGRLRGAARRVEETSAGGVVLDRRGLDGHVVLIGRVDRRGRLLWSLPKGHVEPGETQEDTAVREVAEETGIQGQVLGRLGSIDFWFTAEGRRVHKTVHHFLLLATGGELSDADVEVSEVAWVPLSAAAERLAYPTERQLLTRVPLILAESA
jgi:8-oxo-dGTP pyrophosphatase MutT (NUDIX family)